MTAAIVVAASFEADWASSACLVTPRLMSATSGSALTRPVPVTLIEGVMSPSSDCAWATVAAGAATAAMSSPMAALPASQASRDRVTGRVVVTAVIPPCT